MGISILYSVSLFDNECPVEHFGQLLREGMCVCVWACVCVSVVCQINYLIIQKW